jgi:hypothetical protein
MALKTFDKLEIPQVLELQRSLRYIETGIDSWAFPNHKKAGLP